MLLLTTVPAVADALVLIGQTVFAGDDITVYDGAPDVDNLPDGFLAVGFTRDDDESGIDGSTTDDGNGLSSETYTVRCVLSVATGDTDRAAVAQRRARCAELYGRYAAAIRADPTLGGALQPGTAAATLGGWSWSYGPATKGSYADIEFVVAVTAEYLGAS
ncbi:hypothetical protein [Actinoplanes sp. N902-109]|uniref:hypothetical protein n=1 Tax=Actinoplanes sp. (strain N902-109) TaxID=649831 RepID=UPI00032937A6|nr:hypothetical protein [Actinoplanes sp. N902-109]AGL19502.1 hypothetical protein L083_5992 [Actinoplanes sp. N902-109]